MNPDKPKDFKRLRDDLEAIHRQLGDHEAPAEFSELPAELNRIRLPWKRLRRVALREQSMRTRDERRAQATTIPKLVDWLTASTPSRVVASVVSAALIAGIFWLLVTWLPGLDLLTQVVAAALGIAISLVFCVLALRLMRGVQVPKFVPVAGLATAEGSLAWQMLHVSVVALPVLGVAFLVASLSRGPALLVVDGQPVSEDEIKSAIATHNQVQSGLYVEAAEFEQLNLRFERKQAELVALRPPEGTVLVGGEPRNLNQVLASLDIYDQVQAGGFVERAEMNRVARELRRTRDELADARPPDGTVWVGGEALDEEAVQTAWQVYGQFQEGKLVEESQLNEVIERLTRAENQLASFKEIPGEALGPDSTDGTISAQEPEDTIVQAMGLMDPPTVWHSSFTIDDQAAVNAEIDTYASKFGAPGSFSSCVNLALGESPPDINTQPLIGQLVTAGLYSHLRQAADSASVKFQQPEFQQLGQVRFPKIAKRIGKSGDLRFRVCVGARGRPIEVVQESGELGFGLDRSAYFAISNSRWKPATLDGYQIPAWTQISLELDSAKEIVKIKPH